MIGKRGGIISYLCRQNKGRVEEQYPLGGLEPNLLLSPFLKERGERQI